MTSSGAPISDRPFTRTSLLGFIGPVRSDELHQKQFNFYTSYKSTCRLHLFGRDWFFCSRIIWCLWWERWMDWWWWVDGDITQMTWWPQLWRWSPWSLCTEEGNSTDLVFCNAMFSETNCKHILLSKNPWWMTKHCRCIITDKTNSIYKKNINLWQKLVWNYRLEN